MNIHPIVVHFPIAFLTIYALAELIRVKKIISLPYWFNIKKMLILVGWVGSILAALSGLLATGGTIIGPRIFVLHELFAFTTIVLSTITGILYLKNKQGNILIILAVLILASVTITGGLGGAMVFTTKFDPFMAPIFKLLGVY